MSGLRDRLAEAAALADRPLTEALRHHVLEGLLRRIARLPPPEGFVLRGGMLTRLWARPTPRPAQDLDFVGTFAPDVEETAARFAPVLADARCDDGLCFDPAALRVRGIWPGTAFPGVRLVVRVGLERADRDVQIDIGFNDPLVPAAGPADYPTLLGPPVRLWCVRPETAVAWKLHGLYEKGGRHWRPKDLHDLWLIAGRVALNADDLPPAVAAAFASRGDPVPAARALLGDAEWWCTQSSRVRWEEFCATVPDREVPAELAAVVARVRDVLQPLLGEPAA